MRDCCTALLASLVSAAIDSVSSWAHPFNFIHPNYPSTSRTFAIPIPAISISYSTFNSLHSDRRGQSRWSHLNCFWSGFVALICVRVHGSYLNASYRSNTQCWCWTACALRSRTHSTVIRFHVMRFASRKMEGIMMAPSSQNGLTAHRSQRWMLVRNALCLDLQIRCHLFRAMHLRKISNQF